MSNNQFVKYIFIANALEQKTIGETYFKKNQKWSDSANKIFNQYCKNIESKYNIRNKIPSEDGLIFCTINKNNIFYLGIFKENYSEKIAFQLFEEIENDNIHLLVDQKGELNDIGKKSLKDKLIQYDKEKSDKISEINGELNEIKIEMRENVQKAINNNENIGQLDEKAVRIKENANMFKKEAQQIQRQTFWNKHKWNLIIAILVIAILLMIIVPLATKGGKGDDKDRYKKDVKDGDNEKNRTRMLFLN